MRPSAWLASLLSLRGVLAFWIVYGLAHSALRLSITRALTLDDSRASELVQTLSLGYQVRQPPLYEWLLWLSQQGLGTGIESHLAVRYSLIAVLGLATFGAVRAAVKDDRWAAVASLSLAFSYPVGWTFHEWATQTILLSIACMATLHAAIRFFERPATGTAVFLGLALALGFYSKFSYPLFLGGLVLAALSLGELRARLADPRLILSAVLALAALAPFVLWILRVRGNVVAEVADHMIREARPFAARVAIGLGRLTRSLPAFLLPWLLFVAVLAPRAFMRAPAGAPAASTAERLVLRTMFFAALLTALGIATTGATNVRVLYMHPILMVAPVYVFARVARLAPGQEGIRRFAAFALAVAIFLLGFRLVAVSENPVTRKLARGLLLPYAELADALKARGITNGTVVSVVVRDVGNLRSFLPDLRVTAADSIRTERAPRRPSDARSCVLIWTGGQQDKARALAPIDTLKVERIEIAAPPSRLLATRGETWYLTRLDPRSPACS